PNLRLRAGSTSFGGISVGVSTASSTPSRPERVANAAENAMDQQQPLTAAERDAALRDIARAPAVMQPFLRRAVIDPIGFKRGLIQTMPKMLFALLPMFAGIVALFYRGRKYPEHLYFAIHLHAFIFLALAMTELLKFTHEAAIAAAGGIVAAIWVPVYATLAFRRVYGGSFPRTVAQGVGVGARYGRVSGVAFVVM